MGEMYDEKALFQDPSWFQNIMDGLSFVFIDYGWHFLIGSIVTYVAWTKYISVWIDDYQRRREDRAYQEELKKGIGTRHFLKLLLDSILIECFNALFLV